MTMPDSTRLLWLHFLVAKRIKRIDETYAYLEVSSGYMMLKANKGFFRWLLPWLKFCTVKQDYEEYTYYPYIIPTFDELLLLIEQLIRHNIHQEFIRDNADDPWRSLYESKGYNELLTPVSDNDKIMAIGQRIKEQQRRRDIANNRLVNAKNQLRKFKRS